MKGLPLGGNVNRRNKENTPGTWAIFFGLERSHEMHNRDCLSGSPMEFEVMPAESKECFQ